MATVPFHLGLAASAGVLAFRQVRRIRSHASNSTLVKHAETGATAEDDTEGTLRIWNWSQTGFACLLLAAVSVFPLAASVRGASIFHRISQAKHDSADEVIIFYNPASGILIEEKSRIPGVMSASFQAILRSPYFAQDLRLRAHIVSGDYLYHSLFLPERADAAYILFDRVPDARPCYLRVKVRLLERQKGGSLYRAESFSRFEL
jgi:hypothetical protein